MQWLQSYADGKSVEAVIQDSIAEMNAEELNASKAEAILG
jgi:hypothetical protein